MGSLMNRKLAAAVAAAERCRKERREKRGMRILRVGSLQQERGKVKGRLFTFRVPRFQHSGYKGWLLRLFASVIAGPGLDFVTLLVFDLDLAVGAVLLLVGGGIADVVLATELGGDLVKGFTQLVEFVT